MPITYRPTSVADLDASDALVISSINELTERHGFGRIASRSPPNFQAFCLADDPRGLWTAEEGSELLGLAWSWSCQDLWFLAQLFVKPELQTRGIGTELLRRTLDHADHSRAENRALITFAFNTVSQALYIRHGFIPRFPIYSMSIPRERMTVPPGRRLLDARPLNGSEGEATALAEVDRAALQVSREKHHRFLAGDPGLRAVGLHDGERLVGYAYISQSGHVGPLAVISQDLIERAFQTALTLAAEGAAEKVSCFVPGPNVGVLRSAMDNGLRIMFPMLMMSTGGLGAWSCYLPRNPGFM